MASKPAIPPKPSYEPKPSLSESDRYYTASSGEGYSDDDYESDGDDICIRLDSDDDDNQSLSGMHINLKTLQEVSTMLTRYVPVVQRDKNGHPIFVAPPPPPEEQYYSEKSSNKSTASEIQKRSSLNRITNFPEIFNKHLSITGEDYQFAIQDLEKSFATESENHLFSDAMDELTDVMEKLTRLTEEDETED